MHTSVYETRLPSETEGIEPSGFGLPTSVSALVFAIIVMAGCWSILVAAVHYRGVTTCMDLQQVQAQAHAYAPTQQRGEKIEEQDQQSNAWWNWPESFTMTRRKRYEALHAEDFDDYATALSSAHDLPTRLEDLSPENPFLVAPTAYPQTTSNVKPRGSAEWAEQHRAFFANPSTDGEASSISLVTSHSFHALTGAEIACVDSEAREAQKGRASVVEGMVRGAAHSGEKKSLVDMGLAVVDEAVDSLAKKIVRWMSDGRSTEEMVLPLAKGQVE